MTRRRTVKIGLGLAAVCGTAAVTLFCLMFLRPVRFVPEPLPAPSGYDDLLRAAAAVSGPLPDLDWADEEWRTYFERNPNILPITRLALQRECRVPVRVSADYLTTAVERSQKLRGLLYLFIAEGKSAELDGDIDRALTSYLDAVRFGSKLAAGGLTVDVTTDLACEAQGLRHVRRLIPVLDGAQCRRAIRLLEEVDGGREPWEVVADRDRRMFWSAARLKVRVAATVFSQQLGQSVSPATEQSYLDGLARLRVVATHVGLRAYYLDHNRYPESLSELVPRYLAAVPEDSLGETPLQYQRSSHGYEIRSSRYSEATDKLLNPSPED